MRKWSSFAAALKYYTAEGFLYVESICARCGHTQRTVVWPHSKVVQCLNCDRIESWIVRDLGDHAEH